MPTTRRLQQEIQSGFGVSPTEGSIRLGPKHPCTVLERVSWYNYCVVDLFNSYPPELWPAVQASTIRMVPVGISRVTIDRVKIGGGPLCGMVWQMTRRSLGRIGLCDRSDGNYRAGRVATRG
ncbi:hypothetical protein [Fimbriiglobus ruber]|nr:hypothetical protein [Fimbriiglobus ruber]